MDAFQAGFRHGKSAAIEEIHRLCRAWLAENEAAPEEERLGYPPFHYLKASEAIEAIPVMTVEEAVAAGARFTPVDEGTA